MTLTALVLGDDARAIERSTESVAADAATDWTVIVRPAGDTAPWAHATGERLVLLRAGDRLLEGAGAAILAALDGHPAVVGGHRLGCGGRWDQTLLPPGDPALLTPAALCVDTGLELSAIAAHRRALPDRLRVAPAAPGGDVGLLCRLAGEGALAAVAFAIADVRCRPDHHGDPGAAIERAFGVLASEVGDDPDRARNVRRRLLATLYLDAAGAPPAIDPERWLAHAADPHEVLRDLQWVLARSADEAAILRAGYDAVVAAAPADAVDPPYPAADLHATIALLDQQVRERTATAAWLHDEVALRDAAVRSLQGSLEGALTELARVDAAATARFEAIQSLEAAFGTQNEELARLHREIGHRDAVIEHLGARLGELDADAHGLRDALTVAAEALHTARLEAAEHRDRVAEQDLRLGEQAAQIDAQRRQIDELGARVEVLSRRGLAGVRRRAAGVRAALRKGSPR